LGYHELFFLYVGTLYNPNFAHKDGGTSSRHSVGQTAYDGWYGVAQVSTFTFYQMDASQVEKLIIF
jgi:hypothetical protein